jgi:hypothetical protein
VDPGHGGHVKGGREPLAGVDISVRSVPSHPGRLGRHLLVRPEAIEACALDRPHGNKQISTIVRDTASPPLERPDLVEPELVIREARRRQRRRWLIWLCVALVLLLSVAVLVIATSGSTPDTHPSSSRLVPDSASRPVAIPVGGAVALHSPGPLAVSRSDLVYVVDPSQHRIMVRLASGQFYDVVGDGTSGSGGDGGPAVKAQLSDVSDIAFAPNGDLYIADGARVRVVGGTGMIRTVVGDGLSGHLVVPGTPARSARLGTVHSIAFSPSGQLFLATSRQILRLSAGGVLQPVRALVTSGPAKGILSGFGSIAIDRRGDIYASSETTTWSVYRISPTGRASYVGYARRSGGNLTVLQRNAGQIEADDGPNLLVVVGNRLVQDFAVNEVPGVSNFLFLNYFAVTPGGGIIADNLGQGFDPYQQIVSIVVGHGSSMWMGPNLR